MANNIFPLPELQGDSGSLLSMLAAANSDERVMEDLVEKAAQQAAPPPPMEAFQFGAAAGLQPQASPYTGPIDPVQARVQGGLNTAAGGPERGPPLAGPQSPVGAAPGGAPAPSVWDRIGTGLEGLAGAREDIDKLAGTEPQTVTPQARNFVSGGGGQPRQGAIVPGPNAQSSAYLQSLLQLMQGNRYGGF